MRYLLAVYFLFSSPVFSNSNELINETDKQIIFHTYNLEVEKADQLIKEQMAVNPNSPKYYFLQVGNEIMRAILIGNETPSERKRSVRDSLNTVVLNLTQAAVDKFEDIELTIENKFYLGGLYGYLGRFYGLEGSWMSAFSDAKEGKNMLEEVIEERPDYYDAYILLGMFYYYADRMGGITGFIATVLGFSGDREQGIKYMQITAENGQLTQPQANMLLAELYSRLEDNNFKSFPYFENLIKSYPKNDYFLNWYVRELLDVELISKVKSIIDSDSLNLVNHYNKARYYHLIGEYQRSQESLNSFEQIRGNSQGWYSRNATFLSVMNNLLLGNREKAIADSSSLHRRSKKTFELILANEESSLQLYKFKTNLLVINDTSVIEDIIKNRRSFPDDNILEGVYLFEIGKYYFRGEVYQDADRNFLNAMELNNDLTYDCCKYLIELYLRTDVKTEKVELLMEKIEDLESDQLEWSAKDIEVKYDL